MSVRRSFLLPFAVLLALVALVAGACSSDDSSDEDAKKQYPQGWKALKPYLRIVPQPRA